MPKSKKRTPAASVEGDPETLLLRCLFKLAASLRWSPVSVTIRLIADVIDAREKSGTENMRHWYDDYGTDVELKAQVRDELVKHYGGSDPTNGVLVLIRLRYPPTGEEWAKLIRAHFREWFIPTIEAAERSLKLGGGRRLAAGGHTPATVGADLGRLHWLIETFLDLLPLPKPFPRHLPHQFAAIGGRIERAGELLRASIDYPGGDGSAPAALPGPARPEVRLWEGAEYSERNIRLARTRSAYLEAHGDVTAALAALKAGGNTVGRSTFYDHLGALDNVCPGWRSHMMLSGASGNPENGVSVRPRGKSRARVR